MLDEFPTLGRMEVIQTALTYLAGYGIKAYLIVQDLTQLSHAYGRYESIISNCHVRVAFAANKVETTRLLSEMVGTMTVHREARSYTGSRLTFILPRVTASEQDSARPLLTPDEILRLPAEDALIFVAGHPPVYGRKIRYYADPVFRARAALPPPPASDRLPQGATPWTGREPSAPAAAAAEPVPAVVGIRAGDAPAGDPGWDLT
jgi:type IV secretion system protein VirD4